MRDKEHTRQLPIPICNHAAQCIHSSFLLINYSQRLKEGICLYNYEVHTVYDNDFLTKLLEILACFPKPSLLCVAWSVQG